MPMGAHDRAAPDVTLRLSHPSRAQLLSAVRCWIRLDTGDQSIITCKESIRAASHTGFEQVELAYGLVVTDGAANEIDEIDCSLLEDASNSGSGTPN
jgi:hypothetical protein